MIFLLLPLLLLLTLTGILFLFPLVFGLLVKYAEWLERQGWFR